MTDFEGFPAGARYTAIPSLFFARLLQEIDDLAELKVILHVFYLLQQKHKEPRYVTRRELLQDRTLVSGLERLSPEATRSPEALATASRLRRPLGARGERRR